MRCAGDFVVVTRAKSQGEQAEARVRVILGRPGSQLQLEETRQVERRDGEEAFDCLGCELRKRMSGPLLGKTGRRLASSSAGGLVARCSASASACGSRPEKGGATSLRVVIASLDPVRWGWAATFALPMPQNGSTRSTRTLGNGCGLRVKRKGRNLKPEEAARWPRESFDDLGRHRLQSTARYPEAA